MHGSLVGVNCAVVALGAGRREALLAMYRDYRDSQIMQLAKVYAMPRSGGAHHCEIHPRFVR